MELMLDSVDQDDHRRLATVTTTITTNAHGEDMTWSIGSCSGGPYADYSTYIVKCYLDPGIYNLTCMDQAGDGWHADWLTDSSAEHNSPGEYSRINIDGQYYCEDFTSDWTKTVSVGINCSALENEMDCENEACFGYTWNMGKCVASSCNATQVANSDKSANHSITGTTHDVVTVTCDDGYSGSAEAICQPDGTFTTVTCSNSKTCSMSSGCQFGQQRSQRAVCDDYYSCINAELGNLTECTGILSCADYAEAYSYASSMSHDAEDLHEVALMRMLTEYDEYVTSKHLEGEDMMDIFDSVSGGTQIKGNAVCSAKLACRKAHIEGDADCSEEESCSGAVIYGHALCRTDRSCIDAVIYGEATCTGEAACMGAEIHGDVTCTGANACSGAIIYQQASCYTQNACSGAEVQYESGAPDPDCMMDGYTWSMDAGNCVYASACIDAPDKDRCDKCSDYIWNETSYRCIQCPPNSNPNKDVNNPDNPDSQTECLCKELYYQVSDDDDFKEVDQEGYDHYNVTYRTGSQAIPGCALCPPGAYCLEEGTTIEHVQPMAGYFKGIITLFPDEDPIPDNITFLECLNPVACASDTSGIMSGCTQGYKGVGCVECDDNLVAVSGYECKKCGPFLAVFFIGVACLFIFLAYLYASRHWKKKARRSKGLIWIWYKIFFSSVWILSLASDFAFPFTNQLTVPLATSQTVASLGTTYLELECLLPGIEAVTALNYQYGFYLFGPVITIAMIYITCYTAYFKSGSHDSMSWVDDATATSVVFCFIIQPSLVVRAIALLQCVHLGKVDGFENMYLVEELTIPCWGGQHFKLLGLFLLPMTGLYIVGIPLYGLVQVLWHYSKMHLHHLVIHIDKDSGQTALKINTPLRAEEREEYARHIAKKKPKEVYDLNRNAIKFQMKFGFLILGFEPSTCWYEAVIMTRKTMMTLVSIVLFFDRDLQALIAVLILYFSSVFHILCDPFDDKFMDTYEMSSLVIATLLFMVGTMSHSTDQECGDVEPSFQWTECNIFSGLALLLCFAYGALSVYMLCKACRIQKEQIAAESEPDPCLFLNKQGFATLEELHEEMKLMDDENPETPCQEKQPLSPCYKNQARTTYQAHLKYVLTQYEGYQQQKKVWDHEKALEEELQDELDWGASSDTKGSEPEEEAQGNIELVDWGASSDIEGSEPEEEAQGNIDLVSTSRGGTALANCIKHEAQA